MILLSWRINIYTYWTTWILVSFYVSHPHTCFTMQQSLKFLFYYQFLWRHWSRISTRSSSPCMTNLFFTCRFKSQGMGPDLWQGRTVHRLIGVTALICLFSLVNCDDSALAPRQTRLLDDPEIVKAAEVRMCPWFPNAIRLCIRRYC